MANPDMIITVKVRTELNLIEETKKYFSEHFKLKEYELVCYTKNENVIAEIHCNCEPLIPQKSMQFFTDRYKFFHCKRIKPFFGKEKIILVFFENVNAIKL